MVISDMRRVSVLHLSFPPHLLQHPLQEPSATAPQLESLRLRTPGYTCNRDILNFDFSGDSFNMTDFIHTPSLRLLELTTGSSRPVTVILSRLRSLWLTNVDFCASGCTSESFLACLQSRAEVDSAIQDLHIVAGTFMNGRWK
jgi:hypothetical protein